MGFGVLVCVKIVVVYVGFGTWFRLLPGWLWVFGIVVWFDFCDLVF